jgi:putative sigma-54 modulation protein
MEIVIRGDKIKVTQAINDYLRDKLSKLEKYIEDYDNVRATVVVKVKNHEQKVEVTIPLKKFVLRAEESKEDLYAAIDLVTDKLERHRKKRAKTR